MRAGNLPPLPAGPALFIGQLLNHPPLAARPSRCSPPPLRLAAPARPGPPLAIAPFKVSAWARDQPVAFTLRMYFHTCSGRGQRGGLPARLFTHLQADYMYTSPGPVPRYMVKHIIRVD